MSVKPKDYPPVILILNKVDLVDEREKIEELAKAFYKEYPFVKCFFVSALRGGGMQYLKEYLVRKVVQMPQKHCAESIVLAQFHLQMSDILLICRTDNTLFDL